MAVHLQIAEQVKKHRQAQKEFLKLDAEREHAIEEALSLAKAGQHFETNEINRITTEMNSIASAFQFPMRKQVTEQMVKEYILR
ncbi:DUF2533 family protein [Alkalihalobacillus hemicellulosilyticus]|uniref:DUF2533 domain-containing protein n=1 Tax=Halalkalibacter hemicellulosilyticusJCM 9152 TaxID=1236971 RepID=W4QIE9_9BACI|nr:DUF2533 family protein [Halalkalibacter hemicellulosilyticus]GAE31677.1 hypothetical protein JCM9152_3160 [Halalkalibacter hemicellulosilyticusJCM 9152]